MSTALLRVEYPTPHTAVIVFNDPQHGANILSRAVLQQFAAALDEVSRRSDLQGLMITSSKTNSLLAGADLQELAARLSAPKAEIVGYLESGRKLFQRLHTLPFPTVVAWQGLALGGGAELALWADFRIMADSAGTAIGLPEVKLGLIPGWGGIWTTARWAGLGNALELVCGGEQITPQRAREIGLADEIVPPSELHATAHRWFELARTNQLWERQRARLDQPPQISAADLEFMTSMAATRIQQQSGGHYPAPVTALNVLSKTIFQPADEACLVAAQAMAELVGTPVNRALLHLFFAREKNRKDSGLDQILPEKPRPIQRIGVVGAGIMGYSISAVNLKHGKQIVLHDANVEALQSGAKKAIDEAAYNKQRRGPDPSRVQQLTTQLCTITDHQEFQNCDCVIEAVVENLEIKRGLLKRIEESLAPDAILASNTSTIRIEQLAQGLQRPENFCGMHFFNPVRKMPLVEIIRGPQTSDTTIARAVAYGKSIGKTPVVVKDGPGFLVNRLLSPYLNEAIALLHEGYHWRDIDAAAVDFGMPIGPFAIYDMVGMDTALFAGRVMWQAFPERMLLSPVLVDLYKAGRMGQKTGAGFFRYEKNSDRPLPDPAADELLKKHLAPLPAQPLTTEQLQWRLLLPMLFEAARVIEAGIIRQRSDIDLGVVLGLGFPPFRGGILHWADQVGLPEIARIAAQYAELGERWKLPILIQSMAERNEKFYA